MFSGASDSFVNVDTWSENIVSHFSDSSQTESIGETDMSQTDIYEVQFFYFLFEEAKLKRLGLYLILSWNENNISVPEAIDLLNNFYFKSSVPQSFAKSNFAFWTFVTFCHVKASNFRVFYWDFMWPTGITGGKWYIVFSI